MFVQLTNTGCQEKTSSINSPRHIYPPTLDSNDKIAKPARTGMDTGRYPDMLDKANKTRKI